MSEKSECSCSVNEKDVVNKDAREYKAREGYREK